MIRRAYFYSSLPFLQSSMLFLGDFFLEVSKVSCLEILEVEDCATSLLPDVRRLRLFRCV